MLARLLRSTVKISVKYKCKTFLFFFLFIILTIHNRLFLYSLVECFCYVHELLLINYSIIHSYNSAKLHEIRSQNWKPGEPPFFWSYNLFIVLSIKCSKGVNKARFGLSGNLSFTQQGIENTPYKRYAVNQNQETISVLLWGYIISKHYYLGVLISSFIS